MAEHLKPKPPGSRKPKKAKPVAKRAPARRGVAKAAPVKRVPKLQAVPAVVPRRRRSWSWRALPCA